MTTTHQHTSPAVVVRTIHESFAPKGFTVVEHTDPACPFISYADDILRDDQTTLPDDNVAACRFCAGDDIKTAGMKSRTVVGHIAEDDQPRRNYGDGTGNGTSTRRTGMTPKQEAFIARLLNEREIPEGFDTSAQSPGTVSALIDRLLALPYKTGSDGVVEPRWTKRDGAFYVKVARGSYHEGDTVTIRKADQTTVDAVLGVLYDADNDWHYFNARKATASLATGTTVAPVVAHGQTVDVPAGHYAIPSTGDNDLVFYWVKNGKGKWAGRTFVDMVVGGHPDQPVRYRNIPGILARIAEYGIAESALLYATELQRCSRCNRTLTDETSRALGIGPECRRLSE